MNRILQWALAIGLLSAMELAYADCQVLTSFPIEIDQRGSYCLDRDHEVDVSGSNYAIAISASDVELDLRGHTLHNPVFLSGLCRDDNIDSAGVGIRIFEARNVRVTNGALRCFGTGIEIRQSRCGDCNVGNQIVQMRIQESRFAGIFAQTDFSVFSDNHITETGGMRERTPMGIYVSGDGNTVKDNDIQGVWNGTGIKVAGNSGLVIENRIQNSAVCVSLHTGAGMRFRDNVTVMVSRPYDGTGDDLGNND